MKRREFLVIAFLLVGGIVAIFLPDTKPFKHIIKEKELLYEVNKEGRYISTDEVAKMIIEKDPSLLLIDIRSPEDYAKFTIEGALNIPYNKILEDENLDYFNQDVYTTVLFSNGSSMADEAWLMLRSYDYQGNKVMKGGLNKWYLTILNPQKPDDTQPITAFDQYLFRRGASIYFTGVQIVGSSNSTNVKAPSKPIIKRKKKEVSGGCG